MVSKGLPIQDILLTAFIVLLYRDLSEWTATHPVLAGILPGYTLYHNGTMIVLCHHPHLFSKSTDTAPDESTIFFQCVHEVLGLVKCRMTSIHVDHELLMGRSDGNVKSLPHREPSSDIFRGWGVEEKPLVGMLLALIVTTDFYSFLRCTRSQDKVERGKDLGQRLRVDRVPCEASVCMRGQMDSGYDQKQYTLSKSVGRLLLQR